MSRGPSIKVKYWRYDDLRNMAQAFLEKAHPTRYRFTLAHELAHVILHGELYEQFKFSDVEEFKAFQRDFPEKEYGWIEWQGYALAGFILVPSAELRKRFERAVESLRRAGMSLSRAADVARHMLEKNLARQSEVSSQTIHKRLEHDNLWPENRNS